MTTYKGLVLPLPGAGLEGLEAWAAQLTAELNNLFVANGLASGAGSGSAGLPIYDSEGRQIVSLEGITIYDPADVPVISPIAINIDTEHLADAAITTEKLAALSVDTDKLADLSVEAAKIADSSVEAEKIANLAVGSAAIALLAVGTSHIANAAITSAKIGDAQILNAHIQDAEIDDAKINTLSASKIIAGTIGAYIIDVGSSRFRLDGDNQRLRIYDNQSPANVLRVEIGNLASGTGNTDYGIEIRDSSGSVILSSGRIFDSALVDSLLTVNAPAEAGATVGAVVGTDFYRPDGTTLITESDFISAWNQITNVNVTTFIASAAIDTAQIADAAITNALIDDLAVDTANIVNGAITSAKIGTAEVKTANIETAAVETLKIAGQAVTIPSSEYNPGSIAFNDTFVTIASITFTSTGNPVHISFSCTVDATGNDRDAQIRIVKGANVLTIHTQSMQHQWHNGFAVARDTPSAGSVTYSAQIRLTLSSSGWFALNRTITALEIKR